MRRSSNGTKSGGSTNPMATPREHDRWWRHLRLVDRVWKQLVELDVPSENRLELFRTGHRNEVHLAERASDSTRLETAHHSRCKRCWQHGNWKDLLQPSQS